MPKVLLMLFLAYGIGSAGIVFQKETITATIAACDTLEVQGIYFFVNSDTSTISTPIYYPFPVDSSLKYPHSITVERLSNHRQIGYVRQHNGITWNQTLPPHTTDSIRVTYRQKALQTNGRYILTTTQYWNKPLEKADFTIIATAGITLSYWSFQSDSVAIRNGRSTYHSCQKNFLPERDMMLEWNCEKRTTANYR